jgi:hypothetical protein
LPVLFSKIIDKAAEKREKRWKRIADKLEEVENEHRNAEL